jgi:hypothetical protein
MRPQRAASAAPGAERSVGFRLAALTFTGKRCAIMEMFPEKSSFFRSARDYLKDFPDCRVLLMETETPKTTIVTK